MKCSRADQNSTKEKKKEKIKLKEKRNNETASCHKASRFIIIEEKNKP